MIRKGEGTIVLDALVLAQGRRGKERRLLADILGSQSARNVVAYALENEYPNLDAADTDEPVVRGIQDFLQWILDNQDAIIAFIKAIMELFAPTT